MQHGMHTHLRMKLQTGSRSHPVCRTPGAYIPDTPRPGSPTINSGGQQEALPLTDVLECALSWKLI